MSGVHGLTPEGEGAAVPGAGSATPGGEELARKAAQAEEAAEAVRLSGVELDPEEMAALTAVLAHLRAQQAGAAAQEVPRRAARPDRTLRRRQDLGLWARPGHDQWRRSAGPS